MRRIVPLSAAVSFASIAVVAACVGDDPSSSPTTPDGGGSSSGTTSSGGSSSGGSSSGGSSGGSSSGGSSSGDGSADAGDSGPTPFDVRSLTGLKLWLESTKELTPGSSGGTPFGTWADQSAAWDAGGAGRPDGGRHIAEQQDVNAPTIVANGINGRPTVAFVAGNGYVRIANHADWKFGLGDWIIVSVAKVTSGAGPLWQLRPQATAGSEEQVFTSHICVKYGAGVTNGCTSPAYSASTDPHVYVARRKGDLFTLRVDGVERSTLNTSADPPNISVNEFTQPYVFIGNNTTMQVSEVIVQVGPITDANLTTLENHLKTKFAIP